MWNYPPPAPPKEGSLKTEIVLTDMSGRQVQTLKTNNPITKINTSKLPQGVYVVTAKTPNKKLTAKIVKE